MNVFKTILLIARPAAGKSEIINYLKMMPLNERKKQFHIGKFAEIDDFPMLWTWFEEDHILSELGHPRLHSSEEDQSFKYDYLWDVLIRRICLDYTKIVRDTPGYHEKRTTIIEFARGKEHGGFERAFAHLSKEVLERAAILYINVSWEESLRKNRKRFNPDRPDSILEHGLPDDKLEKLYRDSDWAELTADSPNYLTIQGLKVPYAVFENEDDVTTDRGPALGVRLEETLKILWERYKQRI